MEDNNRIGSIVSGLDPNIQQTLAAQGMNFDEVFQGGGNANNFVAGVAAANSILTGQIVSAMISMITDAVGSYLTEAINKALAMPDIGGLIAEQMSLELPSIDSLFNELSINAEDAISDAVSNIQNAGLAAIVDFVNEKIGDLEKRIKEKIDMAKIQKKIESILKYMAQGPIWVDANLTALANMIIKSAIKEIDASLEALEKEKQRMIESFVTQIVSLQIAPKIEQLKVKAKNKIDAVIRPIEALKDLAIKKAAAEANEIMVSILGPQAALFNNKQPPITV